MKIKILCPQWGQEQLPVSVFLQRIKTAGYDGVDTWIPIENTDRRILFDFLQQHEMYMVSHQYRAEGSTFKHFKSSFKKELRECAEAKPLLINSHTGRDFFSVEQYLELIDTADEFTALTGITVAHETHRGRMGYSPQMMKELFKLRPDIKITADFSHWVCVTESMLENFQDILSLVIKQSVHVHTRVGFEQGPQVGDPRAPEWKYALNNFLDWWDQIVLVNAQSGRDLLPMTTEFGPEPYMPKAPFSQQPMVDQFEINCYLKTLLSQRYAPYR